MDDVNEPNTTRSAPTETEVAKVDGREDHSRGTASITTSQPRSDGEDSSLSHSTAQGASDSNEEEQEEIGGDEERVLEVAEQGQDQRARLDGDYDEEQGEGEDGHSQRVGESWTADGLSFASRVNDLQSEEDEESFGVVRPRRRNPHLYHVDEKYHRHRHNPRSYDQAARQERWDPKTTFHPAQPVGLFRGPSVRPPPESSEEDAHDDVPNALMELEMADYVFGDEDDAAILGERVHHAVYMGVDDREAELKMAIRRMWQAVGAIGFFLAVVIGTTTVLVTLHRRKPQVIYKSPAPTPTSSTAPSMAPSMGPTLSNFDEIVRFLTSSTLGTNAESLRNRDSPQFKAAEWMAREGFPTDHPKFVQRFAFAVFFYATNGLGWCNCNKQNCVRGKPDVEHEAETCAEPDAGYLTTADECDWNGARCDSDGWMEGLQIDHDNVQNSLPSEIARLPKLKFLSLFGNQLSGTLPPQIGNESQIQHLILSKNGGLTGPIPETFRNNAHLQTVSLAQNKFSVFPSVLMTLYELRTLFLDDNEMTGTIPMELGNLTRLEQVSISENVLSGTLPANVGHLKQLRLFAVAGNRLQGTLSPNLAFLGSESDARKLDLDFSQNAFTGTIPVELGNLTHLGHLRLHGNDFHGTMPLEICRLKKDGKLVELTADCDKVSCSCCTQCF